MTSPYVDPRKVVGHAVPCGNCGAAAGEPCFNETLAGERIDRRQSHHARRKRARWEKEFQ